MLLNSNSYPKLDLHGEIKDVANYLVKSFINDNIKLGNKHFVIIHGNGEILKKEVHNLLKKDKRIKEFNLDIYNSGCTVVFVDTQVSSCYNISHQSKGGI